MPYIAPELRDELDDFDVVPESPGELNYLLTRMCLEYVDANGMDYQAYNDVVGALECCKLELYRRHISFYEDIKLEINGDV